MENNFFRRIPTDLDLNGPTLVYTTQPSDVTVNPTDTATFTVAAEATFSGNTGASDSGTIVFQWYETTGGGKTALNDDIKFSGTTTATLTVSDCQTPSDNAREFINEITYTPADEYDSAAKGTAAAFNSPLASNTATLTVNPLLEIISQPSSAFSAENQTATFTIDASLTNGSKAGLVYQWYVGLLGATPTLVENKTYRTQNIDQETIVEKVETVIEKKKYTTITTTNYHETGNGGFEGVLRTPPTAYNMRFVVAGGRGGYGAPDNGGPGGFYGYGRGGEFNVPNSFARNNTFTFRIGKNGDDGREGRGSGTRGAGGRSGGLADGGRGGGAGPRGWSGGGGGGGASSGVITPVGIIASGGGGGGGGGGSLKAGTAPKGFDANFWFRYNGGTIRAFPGGSGEDSHDDGGGGGGGGAGSGGRAGGGRHGHDRSSPGAGGGGGNSDYRGDLITLTRQWYSSYGNCSYNYNYTTTSTSTIETPITEIIYVPTPRIIDVITYQNAVISGQGTDTLSITVDNADFNNERSIYCVVSSSLESNSPLTSDTVEHTVIDTTQINNIVIEQIKNDNTSFESTINLSNGEVELEAGAEDPGVPGSIRLYSIYSPDKDIDIEMDLFGGRGKTGTNGNLGGEGGYSRIRFTLEKKVEYIIAGMSSLINTPFVYRKAQLIAVVGAGGDASFGRNGGDGAGIGVRATQRNQQTHAAGGGTYPAGSLPPNGIWSRLYQPTTGVYPEDFVVSSAPTMAHNGGRTIPCTKGVYYRQQGIAACADVHAGPMDGVLYSRPKEGFPAFLAADGTRVADTDWINRGYKDGYAIQANGGLGRQNATNSALLGTANGFGNGGCGAVGGNGGVGNQGGGGGSGYTDGSITVVSTQLGGSTRENGTVLLRLAV